ncbi:Putative diheme cytochrome c-553 [Caenispirillum salinarum AK4]|uniref:Putative diheme cytochrome c-553 n=1 Tax=Caenispirillum salinarum AK4 TaxID=1238182 RepID=K9H638_9PROT|nr:cytochrome c [Caenispirillum salinarum]EKV26083.1 Putative diheme cytochrome c-553 [Caenispirillum salinarum AK4]
MPLRKPLLASLAVIAAGLALLGGLSILQSAERNAEPATFPEGDPKRGAYLARMSGCIGCHTDAENGGAPLAGGTAIETRFGSFVPPNVTQHPNAGIGDWTVADFARAVRQGTSPDGDPYYPAFPYAMYTRMSDQDVADLWAAFQTVAPAEGGRDGNDLAFPFSIREGLHVWRALHFEPARFEPDPARSEAWNRGAYIVTGPGHCGACHTPRGLLGGRDDDRFLEGGSDGPGGAKVPAITPQALKKAGWAHEDLVTALRTGLTPEGDSLGSGMGEVVRDGTAWLTDADLKAIATYLLEPRNPNGG